MDLAAVDPVEDTLASARLRVSSHQHLITAEESQSPPEQMVRTTKELKHHHPLTQDLWEGGGATGVRAAVEEGQSGRAVGPKTADNLRIHS